jgi:hypothetical protein
MRCLGRAMVSSFKGRGVQQSVRNPQHTSEASKSQFIEEKVLRLTVHSNPSLRKLAKNSVESKRYIVNVVM